MEKDEILMAKVVFEKMNGKVPEPSPKNRSA